MNKTYDELCQEVEVLRGQLKDKRHEFNGLVSMITDIEKSLGFEADGDNGHEPILIEIDSIKRQLEDAQRDRDMARDRLSIAKNALSDAIDALWCNEVNSDARNAERALEEISDAIEKEVE